MMPQSVAPHGIQLKSLKHWCLHVRRLTLLSQSVPPASFPFLTLTPDSGSDNLTFLGAGECRPLIGHWSPSCPLIGCWLSLPVPHWHDPVLPRAHFHPELSCPEAHGWIFFRKWGTRPPGIRKNIHPCWCLMPATARTWQMSGSWILIGQLLFMTPSHWLDDWVLSQDTYAEGEGSKVAILQYLD